MMLNLNLNKRLKGGLFIKIGEYRKKLDMKSRRQNITLYSNVGFPIFDALHNLVPFVQFKKCEGIKWEHWKKIRVVPPMIDLISCLPVFHRTEGENRTEKITKLAKREKCLYSEFS